MLIRRVSLHNVKSYEHADIPFQPGINFVCGENGAGKTTIIEAVGYCLFGHLPYSLAEFLRNGHGRGSVEVVFSARDGCDYHVIREFDGKTSKSPRVSDGTGNSVDLHGNADYDAWFRATAGLEADTAPKHLFEQVLGVSQGTFSAPFLQSAGVRRSVFDALFRVNSFRNAHDRALPGVNVLRDRSIALEKDEALIAQRLEPAPALKQELAELQRTEAVARSEMASTETALAASEREAANQRLLAQEVAAAEKRSVALEREAGAAADREARLKQDITRCELASRAVESAREAHQRYLSIAAEVLAGEARIRELATQEQALQASERQLADLAARTEQGEATLLERTRELDDQRASLASQLTNAQAELVTAESKARDLASRRERLAPALALRDELSQATHDAATSAAAAAIAEERARDVDERVSELKARLAARERLKDAVGALPELERSLRRVQTELAQVRERRELIGQNRAHAAAGRCPFLAVPCATIGADLAARFDELSADLSLQETELLQRVAAAEAEVRNATAAGHNLAALDAVAAELTHAAAEAVQLNARARAATTAIVGADAVLTGVADALTETSQSLLGSNADTTADLGSAAAACREAGALLATARCVTDNATTAAASATWARQAKLAMDVAERAATTALATVESRLAELQSDANGETRGAEMKLAGLRQQEKAAAAAAVGLANQRTGLAEQARHHASLAAECGELRARVASYGDPRGDLTTLREQQSAHAPAHEAYIRHLPDAERLPSLLSEAAVVSESLAAVRGEQAAVTARLDGLRLQYAPERLAELDQTVRARHARLAALEQQLADLTTRIATLMRQIADLEALRERQSELADDLMRHREALALLEAARHVLNGAGEPVAEHFRRQVATDADRIQRKVAGDAAALVWDKEYEVALIDSSGGTARRRVFAQLSGGEQMTVALALRIALMRFLSPIRVGFFDEPTVNLDVGRRANLASMLRGLASEVGQLFLISHDDTFDAITENVTYLQKAAGATVVREEAAR